MGVIGSILATLFGGGQNVIRDTVEVFRPNAEAEAARNAAREAAALAQFAAEFMQPRQGMFDRFMDGLNRLPRPLMAFGTLGLFVAAMVDPIWFSQRMQGVVLVPQPLWWLMGAIVSFYFGARHQTKSHEFQKALGATLARTAKVTEHIRALQDLKEEIAEDATDFLDMDPLPDAGPSTGPNAALKDWQAGR